MSRQSAVTPCIPAVTNADCITDDIPYGLAGSLLLVYRAALEAVEASLQRPAVLQCLEETESIGDVEATRVVRYTGPCMTWRSLLKAIIEAGGND